MREDRVISKPFIPSGEPTPHETPESTPAMLLTQKLPRLLDPSRNVFYRETQLKEGRSASEAITNQNELIEELTRQLKDQENRANNPNYDESWRATYRKNIETLNLALLEANSELTVAQRATSAAAAQKQPQGTGVFGISNFFSGLFSIFSGNMGQKQATSADADSGEKQSM